MESKLLNRHLLNSMMIVLTLFLSTCLFAADDYASTLVNQTNKNKTHGYRLIKTRMWPTSGCLIDTGKEIVNPGESTILKIKNDKQCNQAGIGYEMYSIEDNKKEHLLGYLSHRFADEKFSIQISRFCNGDKCVFRDLNPEQNR